MYTTTSTTNVTTQQKFSGNKHGKEIPGWQLFNFQYWSDLATFDFDSTRPRTTICDNPRSINPFFRKTIVLFILRTVTSQIKSLKRSKNSTKHLDKKKEINYQRTPNTSTDPFPASRMSPCQNNRNYNDKSFQIWPPEPLLFCPSFRKRVFFHILTNNYCSPIYY